MILFKEKLAWAAPIAVILIIALFSVNLFVQGDPKVRQLPIALIVNDSGEHVERVTLGIEQFVESADGEEAPIVFTYETEATIESAFKEKKYYAALVIPEGFNSAVENVVANHAPAKLNIYVNEGFNMTGANLATNMLEEFIGNLNNQHSVQLVDRMDGEQVDVQQALLIAQPIVVEKVIFNPVTPATANGAAPILMAMPAWVGALIGGFIMFLATTNILQRELLTRKQSLSLMASQFIFGIVIALFSGFTVVTLGLIAKVNMPSYLLVGSFVSFAAFCFYILVIAITAWIGKPAITLFMVVMLLGMGVIMTPKEMIPDFFVTFIRPWIPIRFAADGLREIFYFDSGFYTGQSFNIILTIGIVSLIVFVLSILKPVRVKNT